MTRIRKICIISTVHPASDVRIFHKQAKTLVKAGYEVVLIAREPLTAIEEPNIKFRQLPAPKNRFDRMVRLSLIAFKWGRSEQADVYHFHDPELIFVGLLLRMFGKKVVYDVHEDVPLQILSKSWIPSFLRPVLSWLVRTTEGVVGRWFSAVITVTQPIAERFIENGCKTVLVQNFPRIEELPNSRPDIDDTSENDPFVVYAGGISAARGIREMIEAIEQVNSCLGVKLVIAGKFEDARLENEMRSMPGWEKVCFVGWVDRTRLSILLSKAIAGLVIFHPEPNHVWAQPNKLFEYMSAGIPVVASHFTLWKDIVERHHCGILVDPLKPGEIARAITYLAENSVEAREMGENGRRAIEQYYNWEREAQKLLELYDELSK